MWYKILWSISQKIISIILLTRNEHVFLRRLKEAFESPTTYVIGFRGSLGIKNQKQQKLKIRERSYAIPNFFPYRVGNGPSHSACLPPLVWRLPGLDSGLPPTCLRFLGDGAEVVPKPADITKNINICRKLFVIYIWLFMVIINLF